MPELSGHWYNPGQDGHGLTVNVVDASRTIAYWYVYDEVGNPDWYLLDGLNDGPAPSLEENHRVTGSMLQCEGMRFGEFDPDRNQCVEVGDFVINFSGCDDAVFQWAIEGESGHMALRRLSHLRDLECPPLVSSKLAGDWKISQSGPDWPSDDAWFDVTIDHSGYFEFSDGLACLWGGRLSERGDLVRVSYRTHLCGWEIGPIDLTGTYASPFTLCSSGGACVEFPAAMGFQGTAFRPDTGEPFDVYLRFLIPPEDE
jgi:hypothetical protein